jgi:hypothetical protein
MISLRWAYALTLLALAPAAVSGACSPTLGTTEGGDGGQLIITEPGPTEICELQCVPVHPNGEFDYRALRGCLLCQACADICTDHSGEQCGAGGAIDTGCSAQSFSCGDCVVGPCALTQNVDTTFGGFCAQFGTNCSLNPECVLLNNCVVKCIEQGVGVGGAGGMDGGLGGGQI